MTWQKREREGRGLGSNDWSALRRGRAQALHHNSANAKERQGRGAKAVNKERTTANAESRPTCSQNLAFTLDLRTHNR
jgi:hypothetical protein